MRSALSFVYWLCYSCALQEGIQVHCVEHLYSGKAELWFSMVQ